jgi:Imm-5 like putative immunity protein
VPILPKERDPRLITIRRGGTLTEEHHRLLADWALLCAEHVLHLFEDLHPGDSRPREAIDVGRAWIRGEVRMGDARRAAFQANAAVAACAPALVALREPIDRRVWSAGRRHHRNARRGAKRLVRRRVRRFRRVPPQQARRSCGLDHAGPNHRPVPR